MTIVKLARVEPNGAVWRYKDTSHLKFDYGTVRLTGTNVVDGSTRTLEADSDPAWGRVLLVDVSISYWDRDNDKDQTGRGQLNVGLGEHPRGPFRSAYLERARELGVDSADVRRALTAFLSLGDDEP